MKDRTRSKKPNTSTTTPAQAQYEAIRSKAIELIELIDSCLPAQGVEMTAREWIDERKARKAQAKQRRAAKAKGTQPA